MGSFFFGLAVWQFFSFGGEFVALLWVSRFVWFALVVFFFGGFGCFLLRFFGGDSIGIVVVYCSWLLFGKKGKNSVLDK